MLQIGVTADTIFICRVEFRGIDIRCKAGLRTCKAKDKKKENKFTLGIKRHNVSPLKQKATKSSKTNRNENRIPLFRFL